MNWVIFPSTTSLSRHRATPFAAQVRKKTWSCGKTMSNIFVDVRDLNSAFKHKRKKSSRCSWARQVALQKFDRSHLEYHRQTRVSAVAILTPSIGDEHERDSSILQRFHAFPRSGQDSSPSNKHAVDIKSLLVDSMPT